MLAALALHLLLLGWIRMPESVLDSARRLVRQFARERAAGASASDIVPPDRPALPELDRALRRPAAEEKRLANGIVKVATAFGTTYCLKPPPDLPRHGPADAVAVPTTCP